MSTVQRVIPHLGHGQFCSGQRHRLRIDKIQRSRSLHCFRIGAVIIANIGRNNARLRIGCCTYANAIGQFSKCFRSNFIVGYCIAGFYIGPEGIIISRIVDLFTIVLKCDGLLIPAFICVCEIIAPFQQAVPKSCQQVIGGLIGPDSKADGIGITIAKLIILSKVPCHCFRFSIVTGLINSITGSIGECYGQLFIILFYSGFRTAYNCLYSLDIRKVCTVCPCVAAVGCNVPGRILF